VRTRSGNRSQYAAPGNVYRTRDGRWAFHYDPAIGDGFRAASAQPSPPLWPFYEAIRCPVRVIRGASSDILSEQTAQEMTRRGPKARVAVIPEVGHAPISAPRRPQLRHVPSVSTMALDPFPVELHRPEMDVRLRDVVTSADGLPMAAGVMSLRQGSFPWTLDYDEIEYVLEGELHITSGGEVGVGRPGDIIAVRKGSSITFGTPSWARFLYVTYPADWAGAS
jgi:ethanolamine utilization protein EutQ